MKHRVRLRGRDGARRAGGRGVGRGLRGEGCGERAAGLDRVSGALGKRG